MNRFIDEKDEASKAGGKRPGSGRPKKARKGKTLTIYVKPEWTLEHTDAELRIYALAGIEKEIKLLSDQKFLVENEL